MFGVSSSGKTCFLYAMAQVLRNGARQGDNRIQLISNRASQQLKLNAGYLQLADYKWPQKSDITETFDFKVTMQCNGILDEIIPSFLIQDYRGGILEDMSTENVIEENGTINIEETELDKLLQSFRGSSAIIFIIDGKTLIDAMDPNDRDVSHRDNVDMLAHVSARMQIEFAENIFLEYKRVEDEIPPVLIAISKGDLFASDFERDNALHLIKNDLPSIFAVGSELWAGTTIMSLGVGLGKGSNNTLTGTLKLDLEHNIHIPIIFGIYAELSIQYETTNDPAVRNNILARLAVLRKLMTNKVQIYKSGKLAREV